MGKNRLPLLRSGDLQKGSGTGDVDGLVQRVPNIYEVLGSASSAE